MDHGGMDQPMCNMNMLFTWDTTNLCIIFHWWRITSILTLLISLVAIALLTAGYEAVREASRRYELSSQEYANKLQSSPSWLPVMQEAMHWQDVPAKALALKVDGEDDPIAAQGSFLWSGQGADAREKKIKLVKAAFYAAQVFYSFFIMLLFMTYNGWVMLAVAAGAFIGYLGFGAGSSTKSVACH